MAFHVACPITCERICFCTLGFHGSLRSTEAKNDYLDRISEIEEFLKDPWGIKARERDRTVQVVVPKVEPPPPQLVPAVDRVSGGDLLVDEALSAQTKRAVLQKKAAAVKVAVEDYARRFESGDLRDSSKNFPGDQQGICNGNAMCRMCCVGEKEGSERAKKMLSCKNCGRKYHRNCLKSWAQHRDLFHWSSWTCPSCRTCEICRRTGDPNKFMFCKRCDGAYHCYCLQPPHKNVSSGPYLCPKHTRCHSCGSNVPGNGLSVRWFLGYTCCDACGRLFVKGNYCPVCLKVYRDSESTPMVCCDVCQRWVHCYCDGISDEKYLQFQVDGNLLYKCPTCRGECYQVKDLEDAVRELWRRRDIVDQNLIASLRAAAGLPTQENIFSISPYSDDEDVLPTIAKTDCGRLFKFSVKGLVDKSPKKSKDYGKKSSKEKDYWSSLISKTDLHQNFDKHGNAKSLCGLGDDKNDGLPLCGNEGSDTYSSAATGSTSQNEGFYSINQPEGLKHHLIDDVMPSDEDRKPRAVLINSNKENVDSEEDTRKDANKSKNMKGRKLVINLGPRKINVTDTLLPETSSRHREQAPVSINGSEDMSQQWKVENSLLDKCEIVVKSVDGEGDGVKSSAKSRSLKVAEREVNLIKLGKVMRDSNSNSKTGRGNITDGHEMVPSECTPVSLGKQFTEGIRNAVGSVGASILTGKRTSLQMLPDVGNNVCNETNGNFSQAPSHSLQKDSNLLLRLKFKKSNGENQSSPCLEKSSIKGRRSKRKRPSAFVEKMLFDAEEERGAEHSSLSDEIMDAKWILEKLGKDSIGKRVEVHQPSDNSWHKGVVSDVIEGTSKLSVTLDDGRVKTLVLGKQGVRFVSDKQKRSKT